MSDEALSLQNHAQEAKKAIRNALFDPVVDAVVGRRLAMGDEVAYCILKKYRPGPRLFAAYPGAGKSHVAVEIAEGLGEGLPMLFLGLSHKSFDNIPTNIEWDHWHSHSPTCKLLARATKGYHSEWYDCDAARSREAKRPTFAPVEHALTAEPDGMLSRLHRFCSRSGCLTR